MEENNNLRKKISELLDTSFIIVVGSAVMLIGFTYFLDQKKAEYATEYSNDQLVHEQEYKNRQEPQPDPFEQISIIAEAALVWDVNAGKALYSKNSSIQKPLASLTKLMTAVAAADILTNSSTVTVSSEDLLEEGDSGLYANERWSFKNLIDFTLIVSSNDGARAIAAAAGSELSAGASDPVSSFATQMNTKARSIGLSTSRFYNSTGLDMDSLTAGGYGSAEDVATLFEYMIVHHPDILESTKYEATTVRSLNEIDHYATNTNVILHKIPGLIGSKTGYTELAKGNLVVGFEAGLQRPIIVVVLSSGYEERFSDTKQLINAAITEVAKEASEAAL